MSTFMLEEELGRAVNGMYIDHSPALLARIYAQVGNKTCDVTFVVGPERVDPERVDPEPEASDSYSEKQLADGSNSAAYKDRKRTDHDRERSNKPQHHSHEIESPPTREFHVHRLMFACCSDYFSTLLFGDMREASMERIVLEDVPGDAFELLISYVYSGKMELTAGNVMDMLSMSHRFAMPELLAACTEFLDDCMNEDDVIRILIAAEYYQQRELEMKCWELICQHASKVLTGEGVLEMTPPLLVKLVAKSELQADEIEIFSVIKRWLEHESGSRMKYKDDLVPHLRLPLISLKDLMKVVRPSGLIDCEALLDGVAYHADPTDWQGEPIEVQPRGQRLRWDVSNLPAGVWVMDDDQTVTTTLEEWCAVYGMTPINSGYHRWAVRISKMGTGRHQWKGIIGVAKPGTMDHNNPYLPITGYLLGNGMRKRGGESTIENYSREQVVDGDVVTCIYNAENTTLSFLKNGVSLGIAYTTVEPPVVAAMGIAASGAMYTLEAGG